MSLMRDEQDNLSTARILLLVWTIVIIGLILFQFDKLTQPLLTFLSSVYLFLAGWAAGPRMVQYLAPQFTGMVNAVGQAKNVELSTDIAELREKLTKK